MSASARRSRAFREIELEEEPFTRSRALPGCSLTGIEAVTFRQASMDAPP